MATICKQFQRAKPTDTPDEIEQKNFYNSILADKKPYFFRYKYRQLNKELNEYTRQVEANCQTRFCMDFKDLMQIYKESPEKLTEGQKVFIYYYYKFLPVLDSDCVMNKICHYIESVDFQIKKKVRSSDGFDWKILVSENFQPENKLALQLLGIIEEENAKKHLDLKAVKAINPSLVRKNSITQKEEFDKEVWVNIIKGRLEEVCSNETKLANHLVYIFYELKKTLNKSLLWSLVGKGIYETVKSKTTSFYFPIKNPNGSLKFLYENYSIERIMLEDLDKEQVVNNEYSENIEEDDFNG